MAKTLLEKFLKQSNLRRALQGLNRSACAGRDGIRVEQFEQMFPDIMDDLCERIRDGSYMPKPLLRVYIPKGFYTSEMRGLGIPCVQDRMLQAGLVNVIAPLFNRQFSDYSFGFIGGRGCFMALGHTIGLVNAGNTWAVSIDLRKFFDNVPHNVLMNILSERISDGTILDLIEKYLKTEVYERGRGNKKVTKGVPQGGPLSPLLSNIVLDKLDGYLEAEKISFARYADDCIIFCGGEREACHVFDKVSDFIENRLGLEINYKKSSISHVTKTDFLGYTYRKAPCGKYVLDVSDKKYEEFKNRLLLRINELYRRDSSEKFIRDINQITRGWVNYYALAGTGGRFKELDAWFEEVITGYHRDELEEMKREVKELMRGGASRREALGMAMMGNVLNGYPMVNMKIKPEKYYERLRNEGYLTFEELFDKAKKRRELHAENKQKAGNA